MPPPTRSKFALLRDTYAAEMSEIITELSSMKMDVDRLLNQQINILDTEIWFDRKARAIGKKIDKLQLRFAKVINHYELYIKFEMTLESNVKRQIEFSTDMIFNSHTEKVHVINSVILACQRKHDEASPIIKQVSQGMKRTALAIKRTQTELEFLDRNIVLRDAIIDHYKLIITNTNSSSCLNGTLDWFLKDYTSKRSEAYGNMRKTCLATPFTTSTNGYKLAFIIYPNGDGVGQHTHISLGIAVMKGPFDAMLPWPFRQTIVFRLINQLRCGDDVDIKIQPVSQNQVFHRPSTMVNNPFIVHRFISLQALMDATNGFLVEDTLFVQVCIDPVGMRDAGEIDVSNNCLNLRPTVTEATE